MNLKIISILLILTLPLLLLTGCNGEIQLNNVTITGHVKDFLNGISVPEAYISVNSVLQDTTNSWGNFQFDYSTIGSFTVTINKEGYIEENKRITVTSDGEIILPDIRLMDIHEFSGSISGNVMLGNFSVANINSPYNGVKVMATYKEKNMDRITYTIFSDVVEVDSDGCYDINHAKINKKLTVIGFEDCNDNNIIDPDEFFGEHYSPDTTIELSSGNHINNVDILMTNYLSVQSVNNKNIIFKNAVKGE